MKRNIIPLMIFASFLLIGALVADDYFKLGLVNKAATVFKPVAIVSSEFGTNVSSSIANLKNIGKLQNENEQLKTQLDSARQEIARLNEAAKENVSLKNELGFKNTAPFNLQSANVISFDPNNIRDTILIDEGSKNGIKEGQVVLSQGYLVGKISKVYPSTSKLILISDPLSAIPSSISNSDSTGIVMGRIGNGLTLEQVPQSDKVNRGDVVVTSGLGGDFPKGLIIGKIEEIQKISGSIFQGITLTPMVDLNQLERVMVIK